MGNGIDLVIRGGTIADGLGGELAVPITLHNIRRAALTDSHRSATKEN
jgi:hypothetical protein